MDCIFCKIANKTIGADILYEDKDIVAFDDLNPQAPIHKLIIPKRHIATLNDLNKDDIRLCGHIILKAKDLAKELGLAENGYRLLFNCNRHGGQAVYHIHLHLLGGRQMQWPPG